MSDYTDVSEYTPNWNPRTTGSTKENNLVKLEPTADSWIEGYYLGSRVQEINGKMYTIHKVRAIAAGNPAHLGASLNAENGTDFEFFGTSVVTKMLAEKITPGQCIKVQWMGMQQPKKAGGSEYHGWKVLINNSVEPITVQNGVVVANAQSSQNDITEGAENHTAKANDSEAAGHTPAPQVAADGGDDDLPF